MIRCEYEPLSAHTTFRIGGPARYYLVPEREEEIWEAVDLARDGGYPYYIIGRGSNLLFSDDGYDGVIIEIGKGLDDMSCAADGTVTAGAGISMSAMATKLAAEGLTGFEFAAGIPGTLGGGITMNAGAYGGEIKDVLLRARVLTSDGDIRTLERDEMGLGYRTSVMQMDGSIVLSGVFAFDKGETKDIQERMRDLNARRREKQPLEYPSAGSTFKRPNGYFAGKLIEDAGLRGYRVGDAQVSDKHCGFVINRGKATAKDVLGVIRHVRHKVKEIYGVCLEPEVRLIGFAPDALESED